MVLLFTEIKNIRRVVKNLGFDPLDLRCDKSGVQRTNLKQEAYVSKLPVGR
jgi:hypothetical protein